MKHKTIQKESNLDNFISFSQLLLFNLSVTYIHCCIAIGEEAFYDVGSEILFHFVFILLLTRIIIEKKKQYKKQQNGKKHVIVNPTEPNEFCFKVLLYNNLNHF